MSCGVTKTALLILPLSPLHMLGQPTRKDAASEAEKARLVSCLVTKTALVKGQYYVLILPLSPLNMLRWPTRKDAASEAQEERRSGWERGPWSRRARPRATSSNHLPD